LSAPDDVWGHSTSLDAERWIGAWASRDEAIAEGRVAYEGAPFYVVQGYRPKAEKYVAGLSGCVVEMLITAAGDEAGDAVSDYDVPKADKAALDAMLREWAARLDPLPFWVVAGEPERVQS